MKVQASATVAVFGWVALASAWLKTPSWSSPSHIGVDLNADKELATQFGMTDFVDSEVDDVVDHLIQMTGGGIDYSRALVTLM